MDVIIRFLQEGGVFMYPIAIIMMIGLAVAIERLIVLAKEKSGNRRAFDEMYPMLQKRDLRSALNYAIVLILILPISLLQAFSVFLMHSVVRKLNTRLKSA